MAELTLEQRKAIAIATARKRLTDEQPVYSGSVLPFSKDGKGDVSFDTNAGVIGSLKRAFTLPYEAYTGQVDPSSQEGIQRSLEAASIVSPGSVALTAGEKIVPGVSSTLRRQEMQAPTTDQLYKAANQGYEDLRGLGVDYSPAAVKDLASQTRQALEADGILREIAPNTHSILDKLEQPPKDAVAAPLASIQAARKAFSKSAQNYANPTDQMASGRVVQGLDDFIQRPTEESVISGPARDASQILKDANSNYAAAKRSDRITGKLDEAELQAAAANSGQNIGNSFRQRLKSLILNDKQSSGFTPDELRGLEDVVKGTVPANVTRYAGNLLGGGGGLGGAITGMMGATAATMASGRPELAVLGAGVPVLGAVSKKISNALTERAARDMDEITRRRSALNERMLKDVPLEAASQEKTKALIRAYLMGEMSMTPQERAAARKRNEISF